MPRCAVLVRPVTDSLAVRTVNSLWEASSSLSGTRHRPSPSLSLRFLGKCQYLGNHCCTSLVAEGRGTSVSSSDLHLYMDDSRVVS